ncbi:hypothetical protein C9374_010491 [Naegleria lovaniensis]|uniref:Uncharacterized protein n=1 Tax=Naegleria lovaniensis TaxID=51637 RepID=A0AA88GBU2_NAELO|nr:uncharacterized protein C9374_010491 [Naegleria lovaniensis]KAG2374747.1 hypothetical protein C9374_010491 [Naegleria lovaniensis]
MNLFSSRFNQWPGFQSTSMKCWNMAEEEDGFLPEAEVSFVNETNSFHAGQMPMLSAHVGMERESSVAMLYAPFTESPYENSVVDKKCWQIPQFNDAIRSSEVKESSCRTPNVTETLDTFNIQLSSSSRSDLDGSSTEPETSSPITNSCSTKGKSTHTNNSSPKRKRTLICDSETEGSTEDDQCLVIDDNLTENITILDKQRQQLQRRTKAPNPEKKLRKKKISATTKKSACPREEPKREDATNKEIIQPSASLCSEEFNNSNHSPVTSTLNLVDFGVEFPNVPHLKIELDMPCQDNYVKPSIYNKQGKWTKDDSILSKFKVIVSTSGGMKNIDVSKMRLLVVTQKNTSKPDGAILNVNLITDSQYVTPKSNKPMTMYYLDKDPNENDLLQVIEIEQYEKNQAIFTCQVSSSNNSGWKNKYHEYKLIAIETSSADHYGCLSEGFKVAKCPKRKDLASEESRQCSTSDNASNSAGSEMIVSSTAVDDSEVVLEHVYVEENNKKRKLKVLEPTFVVQDGKKYKITIEPVSE